jgi:AcrR family transcriptional regulator
MEDISEALLMTKGSLYYYFTDKEEILYACHDYSLDKVLGILRTVTAEQAGASATDKLGALVQGLVDVIIDELQGSALTLEFSALRPELLGKIVKKRDEFERGLRAILAEGIKSGEFRKQDPKLAGFAMLGAMNWIGRWYKPEGTYTAQDIGKAYAEQFVRGLQKQVVGNR